jgi:L-ascorbate metabolism protein UlaG (beta-lactamase superfamily)
MQNDIILVPMNISNPQLKTIIDWPGTPVDKNGRFVNLYSPFKVTGLLQVLKWKLQTNPFREEKKAEVWQPQIATDPSWLNGTDDIIVLLGHSTFYMRIGGITLLTDPVFGDILMLKRKTPFPVDPSLLHPDYILLSHDHRDHLDKESLQLLARNNPSVRYLTGLNMAPIVKSFTGSDNIEMAGWYQQYNTDSIKITFVPSRHWAKRGIADDNKRLWGGFVIEAGNKRILFGGDSGYDEHYKALGRIFGSFDYVLLGIGAYQPAWFMSPNHESPDEALQAFDDLHAAQLIPMHYGTFDLADEPLGMPVRELLKTAAQKGIADKVKVLTLGMPLKI